MFKLCLLLASMNYGLQDVVLVVNKAIGVNHDDSLDLYHIVTTQMDAITFLDLDLDL